MPTQSILKLFVEDFVDKESTNKYNITHKV